jgi:PTS system mannose-specific IIA component
MILATHGELAKGLKSALEIIMGTQENIYPISLLPGQGIQEIRSEMESKLEQLKEKTCIFIVTDLFGGTPFNSSIFVGKDKEKIRLMTGVNLPMLIQFCSSGTNDPDQLAKELEQVGKDCVQIIDNIPSSDKATSLLD